MTRFSKLVMTCVLLAGTGLVGLAGCDTNQATSSAIDPNQIESYRTEFVVDEEPTGAVGVDELFAELQGDTTVDGEAGKPIESPSKTTESIPVVLIGRIGGAASDDHPIGSDFPWDKGHAAFVITDPSGMQPTAHDNGHEHGDHDDHEHGDDHDHGDHEHGDHEHGDHDDHDHGDDGDHEHGDHDGHDHGDDDGHEHGDHELADHDPTAGAHKEDCGCPFCASGKQQLPQAIVQFMGDDGEPISIDARELFNLTGDEIVVIKGQAKLLVGLLMVDAEQIYIRR